MGTNPNRPFPSPAHSDADVLLRKLGEIRWDRERLESDLAAELAGVRGKYLGNLNDLAEEEKLLEKSLLRHLKQHQATLFDGTDKVDLPHGVLLFSVKTWVKKARTVTVALLRKLGFGEAVKVAESVNWDEIDAWPEERLVMIGTERKSEEVFAYEVHSPSPPRGGEAGGL